MMKQNQFKQNDMSNRILTLAVETINRLSNNLIAAFENFRNIIDVLENKCHFAFNENNNFTKNKQYSSIK